MGRKSILIVCPTRSSARCAARRKQQPLKSQNCRNILKEFSDKQFSNTVSANRRYKNCDDFALTSIKDKVDDHSTKDNTRLVTYFVENHSIAEPYQRHNYNGLALSPPTCQDKIKDLFYIIHDLHNRNQILERFHSLKENECQKLKEKMQTTINRSDTADNFPELSIKNQSNCSLNSAAIKTGKKFCSQATQTTEVRPEAVLEKCNGGRIQIKNFRRWKRKRRSKKNERFCLRNGKNCSRSKRFPLLIGRIRKTGIGNVRKHPRKRTEAVLKRFRDQRPTVRYPKWMRKRHTNVRIKYGRL